MSLTLFMRPQLESSPYFSNHPALWKTEERRPRNAEKPARSLSRLWYVCINTHPT